jgi:flagellar motor switch protein FliM
MCTNIYWSQVLKKIIELLKESKVEYLPPPPEYSNTEINEEIVEIDNNNEIEIVSINDE